MLLALLLLACLLAAGWYLARPWYHRTRARQAAASHHSELQLYHVNKCLAARPDDYEANLMAARLRRRQADYAEAEKHLDTCYHTRGMTEELAIERLLLRAMQGEFHELVPLLQALVRESDDFVKAEALECLTLGHIKDLRPGPAQHVVQMWLKLDPTNPRAYYWRGVLRETFEELEGAFEDYSKSLELAPYATQIRSKVTNMLLEKKEFSQAKNHLDRLLHEAPNDPDILMAMGRWLFHQGKLEEARTYLDKVLAQEPKYGLALYGLGQVEFESGNIAEAESWFRRALEVAPGFALARYSLYMCLSQDPARKDEAQKEVARYRDDLKMSDELKKLIKKTDSRPNDIPLLLEGAEKFLKYGDPVVGTRYLERVLRLQPNNEGALKLLEKYPPQPAPKAMADQLK